MKIVTVLFIDKGIFKSVFTERSEARREKLII